MTDKDCMSEAMTELKDAHPDWSHERHVAAALSKCGQSDEKKDANEILVTPAQQKAMTSMIVNAIMDYDAGMDASKKAVVGEPVVEKLSGPTVDETFMDRIVERLTKVFGRASVPVETSFKVKDNQWFAAYSNNFEDRDKEIFPAKAIDDYVARVDARLVPAPELWVWHGGKQTRVGQADVVARHGHFVLASGAWDDNAKAQAARAFYARHQKDTALSHGFVYNKAAFDGVHYHDFNTFEISLLPRGVEANRFTTLEGIKEMPVDSKKRPYFEKIWGDKTDEVLQDFDDAGKALEDIGAAYKDFGHLTETPVVPADSAEADKALGELVADLIGDQGEGLKASLAALKAVTALTARLDAQDAVLAALKQQLDDRPRSASEDPGTELTPENLVEIVKQAHRPEPVMNSFFGIPVEES